MSDSPPGPDDLAKAIAERDLVAAELAGLPLSNENRGLRLSLNQRRLDLEDRIQTLERAATLRLAQDRVEALSRAVAGLGAGAPRDEQRRLKRELAEARSVVATLKREV